MSPADAREQGVALRVLVVEDDSGLADVIARGLRREALAVDVAHDGAEALEKIDVNRYDVVVLDRDLPVVHGDDVCRKVASTKEPPRILMLTASGTLDDRVEGLRIGADDYLAKPFAMQELVARIRALGRRPNHALPPVLRFADVELDPGRRRVTRGGRDLNLTRKEFGVLEVLMAAEGRVVSSEELLEKVWDENTDPFTNAIRITIMTLRRKLGEPPIVETVVGVGYRLSEDAAERSSP
ncbi:MAG: transcriptional regulatory protein CutR [Acidimicrobiales bacterium]|nr:MAG: transcriptional regulatory protein CutR [Acidimicrobiales bacterium]